MFRANRRQGEQHRSQAVLPNAAVVYAVAQNVEETFEYLRSEDRLSLPSGNVMVALASVGQLLGLEEGDIERLLNLSQKERSFVLTGMSYSEFVDAVRCLAVLHGHLALEALPALQVPDLSHALYNTYMSYSTAVRPHPSGAVCQCRQVAGELPPRLFGDSFLRLCRDAGFVPPEGLLPLASLERIWLSCAGVCDRQLPEHMCFAQFLRCLAVISGQLKSEVFVPVAALGLAQEVPALRQVANSYRLKHYKEVPLNLGGHWSLPHLTFEALAKTVQEARKYEYAHFLADAQETARREEAQRLQLRGCGGGRAADAADTGAVGDGGSTESGLTGRMNAGVGAAAAARRAGGSVGGRVRPWSAGLTVLSPHPRRPGAADDAAGVGPTPRSATMYGGGAAGVSPYAPSLAGAIAAAGRMSPPPARAAALSLLSGWMSEDPYRNHPQQQQYPGAAAGAAAASARLPFPPTARVLERSCSAAATGMQPGDPGSSSFGWDSRDRAAAAAATSAAVVAARGGGGAAVTPGVEGGGRVFLDSARPRLQFHSPSFSPSTSPRSSLTAVLPVAAGSGGGGAATDGARGALARLLPTRRSISSLDVPLGAYGGGVGGGGGGADVVSPRSGWASGGGGAAGVDSKGAAAAMYGSAGVRELRREVEGRLGVLEEQGRAMMALLTQLQSQLASLHTSSSLQQPLSPHRHQQHESLQETASSGSGGGGGALLAPSSPPRSRSPPSRPSSAAHDGRDTARYGVVVRTSDIPGAGTDADVYLTIYGDKGDTGERLLSNGAYNFERGQVSTFVFTAADVGEVHTLRVWMRAAQQCPAAVRPLSASASGPSSYPGPTASTSASPSWHLDAIQVASSATGTRYRFPHRGWVDNVLGRDCILYCKGTAPDMDGDPPGWQPTPPRRPDLDTALGAPGVPASTSTGGGTSQQQQPQQQPLPQAPKQQNRSSPQSPPQSPPPQHRQLQQPHRQSEPARLQSPQFPCPQQQPLQPPPQAHPEQQQAAGELEVLCPSPTLIRQVLSPLPSLDVPSPTCDAAVLPATPRAFMHGVEQDTAIAQPQQQLEELQDTPVAAETTVLALADPNPEASYTSNITAASGSIGSRGDDGSGGGGSGGGDSGGSAPAAVRSTPDAGGDRAGQSAPVGIDVPPTMPSAPMPAAAAGAVGLLLEQRIAELQRRVQLVEEAQADTAVRAAAAIAAAVLVRVPASLLAAARKDSDGGGAEDSALTLLAELLTHLHSRAEHGITAAAAADAQAAAALDGGRRQSSRLAQMQFELSATSQVAEQAATRSKQVSERLETTLLQQQQRQGQDGPRSGGKRDADVEAVGGADDGRDEGPKGEGGEDAEPGAGGGVGGGQRGSGSVGEDSGEDDGGLGGGAGGLSEQVRACSSRLVSLSELVMKVMSDQGAATAAAMSQVTALTADARHFQGRLARALTETATALAAQRQARECGLPAAATPQPRLPVSPLQIMQQRQSPYSRQEPSRSGRSCSANGSGGGGGGDALQVALAIFQQELVTLAQAVVAAATPATATAAGGAVAAPATPAQASTGPGRSRLQAAVYCGAGGDANDGSGGGDDGRVRSSPTLSVHDRPRSPGSGDGGGGCGTRMQGPTVGDPPRTSANGDTRVGRTRVVKHPRMSGDGGGGVAAAAVVRLGRMSPCERLHSSSDGYGDNDNRSVHADRLTVSDRTRSSGGGDAASRATDGGAIDAENSIPSCGSSTSAWSEARD